MTRRRWFRALAGLPALQNFASIAYPLAHQAVLPVCPSCRWPIPVPPPPYPEGLIVLSCGRCAWHGQTRLQTFQSHE